MQQERLFIEFTRLTRSLNQSLGIVPILYGSVGLSRLLRDDLEPRGIDILLPRTWLEEGISMLSTTLEEEGYSVADEISNIYTSRISSLSLRPDDAILPLLGLRRDALRTANENGAEFYELNIADYRRLYELASKQGRIAKYQTTVELIDHLTKMKEE